MNNSYNGNMDPECVALCDAINLLKPDVYTVESCCGHGEKPFRVWFQVDDLSKLAGLLYWFDG